MNVLKTKIATSKKCLIMLFQFVQRCEVCSNLGATVGCCSRGCPANFHFMCARSKNAMFQEDKKIYCPQHADKIDKAVSLENRFDS